MAAASAACGTDTDRIVAPAARQPLERGLVRAAHLGLQQFLEVARQPPQPDPRNRRRPQRAQRDARQHAVNGRGVSHRARDRPDVIERRAQGHDAVDGHLAEPGLQPHQAARGRRNPDRAARVGADGAQRHAGHHGGGRSAARAPGGPRRVERVADGAKCRVFARRAQRELVQVGLADQHGAGRLQPRGDDGVGGGGRERTHVRGGRGGHARLVDQVLERDWDAVQRPAIVSAGQFAIGQPSPRRARCRRSR